MLLVDYKITYGVLKIKDAHNKVFNIKIHSANCLCAFIYHYKDDNGKKWVNLFSFLHDEKHINNIMKNSKALFSHSNVVGVRLNVYYKQARTLIEPMCQSGYKVSCYYKEPKKK